MAFLLDRVSGKLIDFFYNLAKLVSRASFSNRRPERKRAFSFLVSGLFLRCLKRLNHISRPQLKTFRQSCCSLFSCSFSLTGNFSGR